MENTAIIDARGIACPGPVVKAKKALGEMEEKNLKVLIDNPIAVQNLERLGAYMGLKTSAEKTGEHEYEVVFFQEEEQKTKPDSFEGKETAGQCPASEEENGAEDRCIPDMRKRGKVVVISSSSMGEGDEVLGRLLMKGFLYALTEQENLPETVIFYNGGAKLSIEGSDSLEDLKTLEAQGTEIITCGTCLNHYGIADKLAVGRVTNMYEIAEKMMKASCIVKP